MMLVTLPDSYNRIVDDEGQVTSDGAYAKYDETHLVSSATLSGTCAPRHPRGVDMTDVARHAPREGLHPGTRPCRTATSRSPRAIDPACTTHLKMVTRRKRRSSGACSSCVQSSGSHSGHGLRRQQQHRDLLPERNGVDIWSTYMQLAEHLRARRAQIAHVPFGTHDSRERRCAERELTADPPR